MVRFVVKRDTLGSKSPKTHKKRNKRMTGVDEDFPRGAIKRMWVGKGGAAGSSAEMVVDEYDGDGSSKSGI